MVIVSFEKLTKVCYNVFVAAGCTDEEAELLSKYLVEANLKGHDSHGAGVYIPSYTSRIMDGRIIPGMQPEVVKETPVIALIDGKKGVGQLNAKRAMEIAIKKAKEYGIGAASIYNCSHIGRMADYASMALEHDMIGFIVGNVGGSSVAPHGGAKGVFGTNPMCYAIPAGEEEPIILDFATSVFAGGKVSVAIAKGEEMPEGVLLDHKGFPTTNPFSYWAPRGAPRGPLLPFGGIVGYKGYGLCMVVDILGGALSGSGCVSEASSNGVFLMALDISKFRPIEEFKADVDKVVRECKAVPAAPGYVGLNGEAVVLVPGEPERLAEKVNLERGIVLPDAQWKKILETAEKLGVEIS
ncbi:Ldh family oxidoreductase [Thermoproteota archaeon]